MNADRVTQIVIGSLLLVGSATLIVLNAVGVDLQAPVVLIAGITISGGLFLLFKLKRRYLFAMALVTLVAWAVFEVCKVENDSERWDMIATSAIVLSLCGVVFFIIGGWFIWEKHEVIRSLLRARAGDLDGAIALTRAYLKRKGPQSDAFGNMMGFLALQQKWAEVLSVADEAERCLIEKPEKLAFFKGIALIQLERWAESLPYLDETMRAEPENVGLICNCGTVMAGLGRIEEARAALKQAESLLSRQKVRLGEPELQIIRNSIDDLRATIERTAVAINPAPDPSETGITPPHA